MLKSLGVGGWVAYSNLVSTQGPLVLVLGVRVWGQGFDNIDITNPIRQKR